MEHPFINLEELNDKSLDDIQNTISKLIKNMNYARVTGNQNLMNQLNLAINTYRTHFSKRMDAMLSEKGLDSRIKIEKKGN